MSVFKRSRRRVFERAGGPSEAGPNGTLPRAQERVQQALERRGLDWGSGGVPPTSAVVWDPPGGLIRRLPRVTPAERVSKRYGYAVLSDLRVQAPKATLFCQRRAVRKEVLFARGVAGRKASPGRGGRYKRNGDSRWRC